MKNGFILFTMVVIASSFIACANTCTDACENIEDVCDRTIGSVEFCTAICEDQNASQSVIDCNVNAKSCDEVTACDKE